MNKLLFFCSLDFARRSIEVFVPLVQKLPIKGVWSEVAPKTESETKSGKAINVFLAMDIHYVLLVDIISQWHHPGVDLDYFHELLKTDYLVL